MTAWPGRRLNLFSTGPNRRGHARMMMKDEQVIGIAREWVHTQGIRIPGFCGAHLMGSLNALPAHAPFAAFRDVDMNILAHGTQGGELLNVPYQGRIIECGVWPPEERY